jgi:hypothetical protein
VVKKRGDERTVRIGFDTRDRVGWWERGTRARQFKATSSGREGIRTCGSSVVVVAVAAAVVIVGQGS